MERFTWKAKILPGMHDEYKKRHNEIWPEMLQLLREAGICNYSIWCIGDDLFGYYECSKGISHALDTQAKSPIVAQWNVYMKDVMVMEADAKTGTNGLREMFYMS